MLLITFITEWNKWRVRKGRSAVLFLAERGDGSMIPVLASYYARRSRAGNGWTTKVESALIDLLDGTLENAATFSDEAELHRLVETVATKQPLYKANRDLPEGTAYVTAAAIRFLAKIEGMKNRDLLTAITQQRTPDSKRFPNRHLVYDCAVQCLARPVNLSAAGRAAIALPAVNGAEAFTDNPAQQTRGIPTATSDSTTVLSLKQDWSEGA